MAHNILEHVERFDYTILAFVFDQNFRRLLSDFKNTGFLNFDVAVP